MTSVSVPTAQLELVAALLAAATPEAAAELRDIAIASPHKDVQKAARRALYLLGQRRIEPPTPSSPVSTTGGATVRRPAFRAIASAYDGAGNRAILLSFPDPDGGSPTCVQFIINDETGIHNYSAEKLSRREMADLMRHMEAQLETGIAYADIETDYACHLLHTARDINQRLKSPTPAGTLEWLLRIGKPQEDYTVAPVYTRVAALGHAAMGDARLETDIPTQQELPEELPDTASAEADPAIPQDGDALFQMPWFDPWFLEVEQVVPWLERLLADMDASGDSPEADRRAVAEQATSEAIDALVAGEARTRYVHRLEETADILLRRGEAHAARQALFHAAELRSDLPASRTQFARQLVERTFTVALAMQGRQ